MYLKSISLHNFRCYEKAQFVFSRKSNVIVGENAVGKSSLLEAIHLLMTGKSFRTNQISDLIKHGEESFRIEAYIEKHGVEQMIAISANTTQKKVLVNRTESHALSRLLGLLPGAVMTPDDVVIVKGSPSYRRDYLDMQLSQIDPLYVHHLHRYHRAVRQRNALLRNQSLSTLSNWENVMALSAVYLMKKRLQAIQDLEERCRVLYSEFMGEPTTFCLKIKSTLDHTQDEKSLFEGLLAQWEQNRRRELAIGSTLTGPHKDDITIILNHKETRHFGSEGQQRLSVATLRFAEWQRLKNYVDEPPLMLIDDIGISLDPLRRQYVMSSLQLLSQVFLTTTETPEIFAFEEPNIIQIAQDHMNNLAASVTCA